MSTPTAEQTAMFWDAPRVPTPTPRETRDAAYRRLTNVGPKQAEVLALLRGGEVLSDREIADALGWDRCAVNGRRHELVEMGLVVQAGTHLDLITQRHVATWRAA